MRISFSGLLFILLFINITLSANNWSLFGINIGQSIYWICIAVAMSLIIRTTYGFVGLFALAGALSSGFLAVATGLSELKLLKTVCFGIIFILAGAIAYRGSAERLYRHLWIFFAVSVPIMFAQKAGLSSALMVWNTEVFHTNDIYTFDENDLGNLNYVAPLVKTLFVRTDDLTYLIAQGRPSGLLYSNNVLSVFLVAALALSLVSKKTNRIRIDQIALAASLSLVMSLTSIAAFVLLALMTSSLGTRDHRNNVYRISSYSLAALSIHFWLFPGLTEAGLNQVKIIVSVVQRFGELSQLLGITSVSDILDSQGALLGITNNNLEETSYSQFAILLKSKYLIMLAPLTLIGVFVFVRALRRREKAHGDAIIFSLFVLGCFLSQFGVPYLAAPSFQFLLGFGLTPVFTHLARRTEEQMQGDITLVGTDVKSI